MKVKICGLTSLEDALMCEGLGADALGFVDVPGRARSMPIDRIAEICAVLGPMTSSVLVCAPSSPEEAVDRFDASEAKALQLHSLSPEEVGEVGEHGVPVIRALAPSREQAFRFAPFVRALLFESGLPGTGSSYDYSSIPMDASKRVIVAGGLTPGNLHLAKALKPYALDVSSGVEVHPGRKDAALVSEFIRRAKE